MKLTEPKQNTFIISIVLAVLALIGVVFSVGFLATYAFWILFLAFVVLMFGVLLRDF